jgi:hypothetical protein
MSLVLQPHTSAPDICSVEACPVRIPADGSDEDEATCSNFNCSATFRVPCPSGSFCMPDYCSVCTNFTAFCPDGSDQWASSCSLRDNATCYSHEPYGSDPCPADAACEGPPAESAGSGAVPPFAAEQSKRDRVKRAKKHKQRMKVRRVKKWVRRKWGSRLRRRSRKALLHP